MTPKKKPQTSKQKNDKRKAEQARIATWLNGGEPINMDAYITKLMRAVRDRETEHDKRKILTLLLLEAVDNVKPKGMTIEL